METKNKDLQNNVVQSPELTPQAEMSSNEILLATATPSLLLGVLFLYLVKKHRASKPKLDLFTCGEPHSVKVFKIHYRADITVEGRHPWVIQAIPFDCEGKLGKKYCSEPLSFDPSFFLGLNDPMTVYVDPNDPTHYCLDVRDVRNRKRAPLKKAA